MTARYRSGSTRHSADQLERAGAQGGRVHGGEGRRGGALDATFLAAFAYNPKRRREGDSGSSTEHRRLSRRTADEVEESDQDGESDREEAEAEAAAAEEERRRRRKRRRRQRRRRNEESNQSEESDRNGDSCDM